MMESKDTTKSKAETKEKIDYTSRILKKEITILTLLESVAEGVVIVDSTGIILLINKALTNILGYQKDDVLGKHLSLIIPDRYKSVHSNHVSGFFANPKVRPMGIGKDLYAKRKDDSELPVEVSLSFMKIEKETLGLAFVTDISERIKIENELKERNKELNAFASTVAHDLNSSLNSIVALSELLHMRYKSIDDIEKQKYAKEISDRSIKLSNVIREMLLLSSLRKSDVPFKEVNIKHTLIEAINRLENMKQKSNASTKIHKLENPCSYAPWIEEIWLNYISNAIKYGGDPPHIEIGCKNEGEYIRYWVKDNGKGLTEEQRKIVFSDDDDPDKKQIIKGHGLGLSIVARIIKKLNGTIGVESDIGEGSTFYFTLPAFKPDIQ